MKNLNITAMNGNGPLKDYRTELIARLRGQTMTVPDLTQYYSGWTIRKHHDVEELRQHLEAWFTTHVPTEKQRAKQRKVDTPLLSAYFWTRVPKEKLKVVAEFLAWAFFWDDEVDCGSLTNDCEGRADAYCDNAIAFIRSCMQPELDIKPPVPGLMHNSGCFVDIGNVMQAGQTPESRDRFMESVVHFIESVRRCHAHRAVGIYSLDEYIERRAGSVGMRMVIHTFAWSYSLTLPPWIWDHEATTRMIREATISLAMYNDIVSLKKELNDGDVENIIPVLVNQEDVSAQEAVDMTVRIITQSYQDFSDAVNRLRLAVAAEDSYFKAEVDTLIDACMDTVTGNVAWSVSTPRYIPRDAFGGQDRRFSIVL